MYDELIKALRGCVLSKPCDACPYYDTNGPTKECATLNIAAADAIEELQGRAKVLEKVADKWCEAVPKWIPVTERLPLYGQDVLAVRTYGDGEKCQEVLMAHISVWNEGTGEKWWNVKTITHWMPLPQPPKEEI